MNPIPKAVSSLLSLPSLGIALGTEFTELASGDWNDAPSESGSSRKEVAPGYSLSATFSLGRVSDLILSTQPNDEDELRALGAAFVAQLTPVLGTPIEETTRFERHRRWSLASSRESSHFSSALMMTTTTARRSTSSFEPRSHEV